MLLFGISEKEDNLGRHIKIFIFIFYWEFPFYLILFLKFKNCLVDWFVLRINNFQKNSPRKFQHHLSLGWMESAPVLAAALETICMQFLVHRDLNRTMEVKRELEETRPISQDISFPPHGSQRWRNRDPWNEGGRSL